MTGVQTCALPISTGRTAALNVTLENATLAATSVVAIKAALSATLADASLSSAADLAIKAELSATLQDATLSATATVSSGAITAELSATLADATLSAQATISQSLPAVVYSGDPDSTRRYRRQLEEHYRRLEETARRPSLTDEIAGELRRVYEAAASAPADLPTLRAAVVPFAKVVPFGRELPAAKSIDWSRLASEIASTRDLLSALGEAARAEQILMIEQAAALREDEEEAMVLILALAA